MFDAESEPWLLDDRPRQRLGAVPEAALQPILAGHEVVDLGTVLPRILDGQSVGDDSGPLMCPWLHETALVGVDPIATAEVVEHAQRPVAALYPEQFDGALGEPTFD